MRVDSPAASVPSPSVLRRERDHEVQNVFSQVLAEAGLEGYASATAPSSEEPLANQVSESWSAWFDGERQGGRYVGEAGAAELKQTYGEILVRAYEEGGYADPVSFLQSLSAEELEVVQRVHRLADSIGVASLSQEGAVNLLLPPAAQVDLNHDGLTRSGAAYGLRFPDSTTPPGVVAAWEDATEGMDFRQRMTYQLQMKLPLLTANIVCDENGAYVTHYEPGDPEFTNPMASPGYSYLQAAQDRLDYLDCFKAQLPGDQYERDKAFWTAFRGHLREHGAR